MSPTSHRYFAGMLGCGLLLGLLALQAIPAAGSSFNIYVVNSLDNNVVVFNSDAETARSTFPVGTRPFFPFAIAITPDGSRVYVADSSGNSVALLTVPTTFIPRQIPLG